MQSIADHRVILAALEYADAEALVRALGVHERRIYDSTCALLATSSKRTAT